MVHSYKLYLKCEFVHIKSIGFRIPARGGKTFANLPLQLK